MKRQVFPINGVRFIICFLFVFLLAFPTGSPFARALPPEQVYVGGFPVGLVLKPKGVIVVGAAPIETELGSVTRKIPLAEGDIIETLNGKDINTAADIRAILNESRETTALLGVRRGTAFTEISLPLIREDMTGQLRLGLRIREDVAGVGTVTYVRDNGAFCCLGHPITLPNGSPVPSVSGQSFDCKIVGVERGVRGRAGELKGAFTSTTPSGTVRKNCLSGVYGTFRSFGGANAVEVASRQSVRPGKASILATVGDTVEEYEIEIIKASVQNAVSDKSMVVRVTDKRLIERTGGIVQGMSGSPILQNGKLAGAITHVFVSDPTKGYGIYADWMMQNEA